MSAERRLARVVSQLSHNNTSNAHSQGVPSSSASCPSFVNILVHRVGRVGIITLNRPTALNALNDPLMTEVGTAVKTFDADDNIGCIILTGQGNKAFAAGADIKEMEQASFSTMVSVDKIGPWEILSSCRTPLIAAVNGLALGGGCEIAMMCDIILAADTAKFGQPEIKLATIPGAGGTQRLTRAIGKSRAMEMCLTGNMLSAVEAQQRGLVSRVIPADKLSDEALKLANQIASLSKPVVKLCKEAVNTAYESTLREGVHFERKIFHSTFALADRQEGMTAFVEKRAPKWKHQ